MKNKEYKTFLEQCFYFMELSSKKIENVFKIRSEKKDGDIISNAYTLLKYTLLLLFSSVLIGVLVFFMEIGFFHIGLFTVSFWENEYSIEDSNIMKFSFLELPSLYVLKTFFIYPIIVFYLVALIINSISTFRNLKENENKAVSFKLITSKFLTSIKLELFILGIIMSCVISIVSFFVFQKLVTIYKSYQKDPTIDLLTMKIIFCLLLLFTIFLIYEIYRFIISKKKYTKKQLFYILVLMCFLCLSFFSTNLYFFELVSEGIDEESSSFILLSKYNIFF